MRFTRIGQRIARGNYDPERLLIEQGGSFGQDLGLSATCRMVSRYLRQSNIFSKTMLRFKNWGTDFIPVGHCDIVTRT